MRRARQVQVALLALVLCIGAAPAVAGAKQNGRTVTGEYNTIKFYIRGDAPRGRFTNGVVFKPRPGERFVSVSLQDDSGFTARAMVGQDLDGDRVEDVSQEVCGATDEPIRLRKDAVVMVWAQEGPCQNGTAAMATFGTVTATFTR